MERLFTIGVYGCDGERFFDALQQARIDLFLDLRRRRGVRGREYAFANANRLQKELEARGTAYRHILELALASNSSLIVSSDSHLLEMSPWRGIPIIRPEEFVGRIDAMRRAARRRHV